MLSQSAKPFAPGEDRTHDLQMARICVIMRLTRYLLRYRGTENIIKVLLPKISAFVLFEIQIKAKINVADGTSRRWLCGLVG